MREKEYLKMGTEVIVKPFLLNNTNAEKIILSEPITLKRSDVVSDIQMNPTDRIKNAANILKSRECK